MQDHEEFASHRLNKDVWSNETILTLLRGNFIFWQRNKALKQARRVGGVKVGAGVGGGAAAAAVLGVMSLVV